MTSMRSTVGTTRFEIDPARSKLALSPWLIVVFVTMAVWTLVTALTPVLRFDVSWPRVRVPLETGGAVIACLAAGLAYIWYSFTGSIRTLCIAVAFVCLGFNQILFGVIANRNPFDLVGAERLYFWSAGRLLAAGLLLFGALTGRGEEKRPIHPFVSFALASVTSVAALLGIHALLTAYQSHLPVLSGAVPADISRVNGPLGDLTAADIALGLTGAALFFLVAILYLPRKGATSEPRGSWLSLGLMVAGFSHLHYMFFPTVFTDRISTGDLLRIGISGVLFVGLLWEVRLVYLSEHESRIEIERMSRAKAELSKILTHDMLASIGSLRTVAVHLAKRWSTLSDSARQQGVQLIESETVQLRDLADRTIVAMDLDAPLLPLSRRIEPAGDVLREASAAHEQIGGRVRVLADEAAARTPVSMDRSRIREVLDNLISNAHKYSTPASPIHLELRASPDGPIFSVTNTGPGIREEDIPSLFERFTRANADPAIHGWGLGLFISKLIVEEHGGSIWAASEPGASTTFSFLLPAALDGPEPPAGTSAVHEPQIVLPDSDQEPKSAPAVHS